MSANVNIVYRAADASQTYDDFGNPEVIVTTYDDRRLGLISDSNCRYEQDRNGPTFVAIRPNATDEQLRNLADRLRLDVDGLKRFRAIWAK